MRKANHHPWAIYTVGQRIPSSLSGISNVKYTFGPRIVQCNSSPSMVKYLRTHVCNTRPPRRSKR